MERETEQASVFRYIQASKIIQFYSTHSEKKVLRVANIQKGKGGIMSPPEFTDSSSENNWEEFLVPLSDWDRKVAEELARRNDVWPLTEEHWKVIEYVRGYYLKFSQGPAIIKVSQATGLSLRKICELFPCGMVRGAYRIAGLPRPPGCA